MFIDMNPYDNEHGEFRMRNGDDMGWDPGRKRRKETGKGMSWPSLPPLSSVETMSMIW